MNKDLKIMITMGVLAISSSLLSMLTQHDHPTISDLLLDATIALTLAGVMFLLIIIWSL